MKLSVTNNRTEAEGKVKLFKRVLSFAELVILLVVGMVMLSFLPA